MKLIIAHLPTQAFDSVRTELLGLGVSRLTISEVHSSGPGSAATLQYRGAPLPTKLRPELKLECLTTAEQSAAVVNVMRGYAGARRGLGGHVAVLDVEEIHEVSFDDEIFLDDPRLDTATL